MAGLFRSPRPGWPPPPIPLADQKRCPLLRHLADCRMVALAGIIGDEADLVLDRLALYDLDAKARARRESRERLHRAREREAAAELAEAMEREREDAAATRAPRVEVPRVWAPDLRAA
ncbi:hypothetical protein [Microcystis phage Mae-JY09]